MNKEASKPKEAEMHECYQKERLKTIDDALFHNGFSSRMARVEEKLSWVLRLSIFLATTWVATMVGLFIHYWTKGPTL